MDHAGRVARLRADLERRGAGVALITNLVDVRWLVGFTGSAGDVVVTPDAVLLLTDGRYATQAVAQVEAAGVAVEVVADHEAHLERLTAAVRGHPGVALQAEHISWARQRAFAGGALAGHELLATEGMLTALRATKEDAEVARIQAAAAIADAALAAVMPRITAGTSERDLALALDTAMRELGASGPSFETIVASGPNGARPHHRPGDRVIQDGDLVVIDFGATVDGYRSDMTRTFAVGRLDATQQLMLEVVTAAQAAGVAAVRDDVVASTVDAACRDVIAAAGWGDAFVHGTGHGVGLDIHEEPRVGATSQTMLRAGQIVTVEPGVYLPEHGGVRVEDTLLVTATGSTALTRFPKS
jgi:Xaa-Pro aminopeptidase